VLLFIIIDMEVRIIGIIFKVIPVCSGSLPDQYPAFTNCSIIKIFIQVFENEGTPRVILVCDEILLRGS
jgi:hypothetical protein